MNETIKEYIDNDGLRIVETYYDNKLYRRTSYYTHHKKAIISDCYYLNLEFHREDGPAYIYYHNNNGGLPHYGGHIINRDYYLYGKKYTKENYNKTIKILKNLKKL
jgi:hypothetical protein